MIQMERIQGRLAHVVAAIGDIEYGGTTRRFGTLERLRLAAQQAEKDGVHGLILLGDVAHHGTAHEMLAPIQVIQSVTEIPITVITGNRDIMQMDASEAGACIETTGATVLDNRVIVTGGEFRIAHIGMNGSVTRRDVDDLHAQGLDKRNWGPQMYRRTEELYAGVVATHVQAASDNPAIDQLVLWSHIPVVVEQQPDYVRDSVLEVHPSIGESVRRSKKSVLMASGHIHSESGRWATLPKWNQTEERIPTLSTTVETSLQQGWPLFEYILFTAGHVATPVTGERLRLLRDGYLGLEDLFR